MGSGLGASFRPDGATGGYLTYFYPGAAAMLVLFTSIFSMISLIQDRNEGVLQGVLVSPVPRSAIVLGKVCGGTTLAVGQAAFFLVLAPLAGIPLDLVSALVFLGAATLTSLALTSFGFLLAWPMGSVQGFHAIMNLVLFPAWLLSGAIFPASGAAVWIQWLMKLNPLTYGVAAMRAALPATRIVGGPSAATIWGLSVLAALVGFGLAVYQVRRPIRP